MRSSGKIHLRCVVMLLGLVCLLMPACGRRASVSGQVFLQGQPLTQSGVVISFLGEDGRPVTTEVGTDGTYQAVNVPLGEVRITVIWNAPVDPADQLKPKDFNPEDPNLKEQLERAQANPTFGLPRSPIPLDYSDPFKSGLKTVLVAGENKYDVYLKR